MDSGSHVLQANFLFLFYQILCDWIYIEVLIDLVLSLVKGEIRIYIKFIYMMDYIDRFSYVEPVLHLRDEVISSFKMDFFIVFLDLVYQYFI